MRAPKVSPPSGGYVITEQGRYDLVVAQTCDCNPRLAGLLIECPDCGTIYGSLREGLGRAGPAPEKRR